MKRDVHFYTVKCSVHRYSEFTDHAIPVVEKIVTDTRLHDYIDYECKSYEEEAEFWFCSVSPLDDLRKEYLLKKIKENIGDEYPIRGKPRVWIHDEWVDTVDIEDDQTSLFLEG